MSTNRVLTGLVAFAGGFLAGVLMAPGSGEETRERLSQEARNRMKRIEGQLSGVEDRLAAVSEQLRTVSDEVSERVRHATIDQVLPEVPDDPEAFKVEGKEVASDLRKMPRK